MSTFDEIEKALLQLAQSQLKTEETTRELKQSQIDTNKAIDESNQRLENMINESNRKFDESNQRLDNMINESNRKFDESNQRLENMINESNRKFDESNQRLENMINESNRKFDESNQRLENMINESNIKFDHTNKMWENFIGNTSDMVEEYFFRSLEEKKTLGNLKFDSIKRNIRKTDNSTEFDIILINGDSIGIIEVKNKAHPKDIKPLIKKKIKYFKLYYPKYENYKYYFGLATMITNNTMIQEAKDEGIFLLTQKNDHLELVNEGYKTF